MRKTGGKRRGFCNWILSPLKRLPLFQVGSFGDKTKFEYRISNFGLNTKSEYRNPKQIQIFKCSNFLKLFLSFIFLSLIFVSIFVLRYSSFLPQRAEAALPQYLPLSARLMTTDYENVSAGTYSITFRIYSVETGGTAVWTETQSVTALRGIFTVTLGSVTSLSSINLANGNFYLTVQLAGDTEMSPRKQILPTATALFAGRVQSSSTLPSSTVGAGELFFNSTSNLLYASDGSSWNIVGGDLQQSTNIGATTTNALTVGGLTSTGATSLQTTLGVTGATTLSSTLNVTGISTLSSTLNVAGATTLASLTVAGPTALNGDISLGNISISSLSGNIIPSTSGVYDLGSATKTFSNAYIDNLVVGSTSTSGTTATSFTINDDAAGDETSSLGFSRGAVFGSAALQWSTTDTAFRLLSSIGSTTYANLRLATLTASSLTDGTATLTAGALSGVTTITTSGTINGATISAGSISSGTWTGTTVGVGYGGTGLSSFTIGDMIYASGATTLSKLADVATGSVLISGGVGVAPAWSNSPSLTALTATGAIQGGSLTDGTATLTAGALSGITTIATSSTINGLTISSGAISGATTLSMSGALSGVTTLGMSGALSGATTGVFSTSATTPLIIGGTTTTSDLSLKTTSGVGEAGADMHFLVGNNGATEAMTILNSGYVGIGTTSPTANLHVNYPSGLGSILVSSGDDGSTSAMLQLQKIGGDIWSFAHRPSWNLLAIYPNTQYALGLNLYTNLRVGIGGYNVDPGSKLGIKGNVAVGTNYYGTAAPTDGMIIEGNVGIGTTAPTHTLEVLGTTNFPVQIKGSSGGGFILGAYDATYGGFWSSSATPSTSNYALLANSAHTVINAPTGSIFFSVGDVAKNIMLSNGNVGIGTTGPTAQLHLVKADSSALTDILVNPTLKTSGNLLDLQVGGASKFSVSNAGVTTIAGTGGTNNLVVNGRIQTGAVSDGGVWVNSYNFFGSYNLTTAGIYGYGGTWRLLVDYEGSVGIGGTVATAADIISSGAMVVKASGNIGIGTTGPYGKLDIIGAVTGSANYGLLNIGPASTAFDGATAGYFVGSASGTEIAVNAVSGFAGNLADLQVAGVSKFLVSSAGAISGASWTGSAIGVGYGGTGNTSYAVGDLIYASGATTLSKLADVATGSVLISGGVGVAPAWSASPALTTLTISTINATAATNLSIQGVASYGVIFNDSGADVDFRIESDNNANIFFLNAGTDAIYFGDGGTTDYTKFDTTGARTMAGGAMPVAEISLLPDDFNLDLVAPPALNNLYGTNYQYDVLDYDKTADEVAYISFKMPGNYEAGTNIVVELIWQANVVANEAVFGVQYKAVADGEVIDAAMSTAVTGTFTTNATANYRNTHSITLISPDVAPEETVTLKIYRDADAAADDLDADARLLNVNIQFNVNS